MHYPLSCAILILATMVQAHQQRPSQVTTTSAYQTQQTFPEGRQDPRGQMPPDTKAPAPRTRSSRKVEGRIVHQFRAEPTLSGTYIDARVDNSSVVLIGSVDTSAQHDLAVQIARSNAGGRRIVDRVEVKQQK